jgi:hypothetical protein
MPPVTERWSGSPCVNLYHDEAAIVLSRYKDSVEHGVTNLDVLSSDLKAVP